MSTDTTHPTQQPTIGVDAASLEQYSAVRTETDELIVYDERNEDAWVQSDDWIDALTMA
ncbi:hypothetical protein [Natronorubrum thiooxidans]|uniref:Uncharacterized protein n=1 Tax=Natronorubrum thiooxidans TaxID=308853 RepID=A0A1N7H002_9EURY|nr:hypothetical protein [Natronorubrum thiooxidans]SIS18187.1 hypothetical protein SAMN05421752_11933 [Natronorubrum thiooxidans]